MCRRKQNILCILMIFVLVSFGIADKDQFAELNAARVSTESSNSYISESTHESIDEQACTAEMLGNYENPVLRETSESNVNTNKNVKVSFDFLNENINIIVIADTDSPYLNRVNQCNAHQQELVAQYEHMKDGKKQL